MAVVKYKGKFGKFEYDDTVFSIGFDENGEEFFHYDGHEVDGSKIKVPDGVTNATGLFMNTGIVSQPELPASVRIADYVFAGCKDLKEVGPLPEHLKSADSAYTYCVSIRQPPVLPDELESSNYMFDGCLVLESMANFPSALRSAEYMYANCPNLRNRKPVPASVVNKDSILFNSDDIAVEGENAGTSVELYDDYEDLGNVWHMNEADLQGFVNKQVEVYEDLGSDVREHDTEILVNDIMKNSESPDFDDSSFDSSDGTDHPDF